MQAEEEAELFPKTKKDFILAESSKLGDCTYECHSYYYYKHIILVAMIIDVTVASAFISMKWE